MTTRRHSWVFTAWGRVANLLAMMLNRVLVLLILPVVLVAQAAEKSSSDLSADLLKRLFPQAGPGRTGMPMNFECRVDGKDQTRSSEGYILGSKFNVLGSRSSRAVGLVVTSALLRPQSKDSSCDSFIQATWAVFERKNSSWATLKTTAVDWRNLDWVRGPTVADYDVIGDFARYRINENESALGLRVRPIHPDVDPQETDLSLFRVNPDHSVQSIASFLMSASYRAYKTGSGGGAWYDGTQTFSRVLNVLPVKHGDAFVWELKVLKKTRQIKGGSGLDSQDLTELEADILPMPPESPQCFGFDGVRAYYVKIDCPKT